MTGAKFSASDFDDEEMEMTQQAAGAKHARERHPTETATEATRRTTGANAFKPVALPALAAAVRAARMEPRPKNEDLPAILRKDAALG